MVDRIENDNLTLSAQNKKLEMEKNDMSQRLKNNEIQLRSIKSDYNNATNNYQLLKRHFVLFYFIY